MARKIRKRYVLYTLCLFANCLLSIAFCIGQPVSSPNVKCLSVNASNGDVTLTWETPPGPAGFLDYQIFSAPVAVGPYTQVGTVNTYAQNTFTDVGAGANLVRKFYRVQTEYNPGPVLSLPQDTFSTIFLQVAAGLGIANLSWNNISFQNISTSTGWYRIYREYPSGVWTLRDSTQTLAYTDVIDICSAVLNYRIEIDDNSGCTSVSNVAGGIIFEDKTPPVQAPIDTVSVDATTSQATISWSPSPSPDADSIVIYKWSPGWIKIATVPVPVTSYINPASNAGNVSELYSIAFLDSCGNISPISTFHKTIYLSTSFNVCAATADLIWNKYMNWTPDVSEYEIWKSVNGGGFSMIGTNTNSDTTFLDTGLVLGTPYCYFIRAKNISGKTSSSNRVCFSPSVTMPPTYHYNRFATVLGDKSILVKAHVHFSSSVKSYRIQRATGSGSFSVIMPAILPTGSIITYTDIAVNTTINSYIYKIDAMDSCGHVITTTNADTTILLSASIAPDLYINLTWNDYGSWLGTVDHYNIYRAVDGVWDPAPIGTYPYSGTGGTYTDDIAPFLGSKGNFAYYVVAVEGSGNTFGFTDSSSSNIARTDLYPQFYVPNAFTPNGDNTNDVFLPFIGFVDPTNYSLMIFDRTGTPISESRNPAEGWDGKKKGHPCQAGVYMYLIKCKASNGDDSRISGTISLFR